jgi:hypothetical protein
VLVAVRHLEVIDDVALVPDMVSGGDDIDAELEQVLRERARDAEAAGDVLSVRNHKINGMVVDQAGQSVLDNCPSRPTKDIAYK